MRTDQWIAFGVTAGPSLIIMVFVLYLSITYEHEIEDGDKDNPIQHFCNAMGVGLIVYLLFFCMFMVTRLFV